MILSILVMYNTRYSTKLFGSLFSNTTGHQRAAASSSDSIVCDGNIDTTYNCYQCFDGEAKKYFWGSSCKAKKFASKDMVNGICGLNYTCVTKDIGTCPYNDYCPDNAESTLCFILSNNCLM